MRLSEDQLYVFNAGTTRAAHCKVWGQRECASFEVSVYNADNLVVVHATGQKHVANVCAAHKCSTVCVRAPGGPKCVCDGGRMVEPGVACSTGASPRRVVLEGAAPEQLAQEESGSVAGTIFTIIGWVALAVLLVGLVYWAHMRNLFGRKFVASVHFQNPRTTLAGTLDGVGGGADGKPVAMCVPQMCQTKRYNEIYLRDISTVEMCEATPDVEVEEDRSPFDDGFDDGRLTTHLIGKE